MLRKEGRKEGSRKGALQYEAQVNRMQKKNKFSKCAFTRIAGPRSAHSILIERVRGRRVWFRCIAPRKSERTNTFFAIRFQRRSTTYSVAMLPTGRLAFSGLTGLNYSCRVLKCQGSATISRQTLARIFQKRVSLRQAAVLLACKNFPGAYNRAPSAG